MNWPSEKAIVSDILTRIRVQRSFKFLLFFKYVINVEILEEFMHMYSNEQETVKLELSGVTHMQRLVDSCFEIHIVSFGEYSIRLFWLYFYCSHKRMSTRGADKEDREDFRQLMRQQVCRDEPLHILITQFLLEEEKFICWTWNCFHHLNSWTGPKFSHHLTLISSCSEDFCYTEWKCLKCLERCTNISYEFDGWNFENKWHLLWKSNFPINFRCHLVLSRR